MRHVVIFAGTTEGRTLAGILDRAGVPLDICVATEYGEMILPGFQKAKIHRGRMDEKEMETFLTKEPRTIVVDATHPFAQEVSSNIREAAAKLKLDYLRLLRDEQACLNQDHVKIFSKIEEGADFLISSRGIFFSRPVRKILPKSPVDSETCHGSTSGSCPLKKAFDSAMRRVFSAGRS